MGKVIAIIPARGGSKRLPNKNVKIIGGIPLLAHSIRYALSNLDIVDDVYVSSDNENIKNVALQYGAKAIHRPSNLSGDEEPTVTAIKHALDIVENVDTVILLQPTNPLRPKDLLRETYSLFKKDHRKSLFTVSKDLKKLGKIIDNQYKPYNYKIGQRSQDIEPLYFENGMLYITSAELIKKDIIFNESSIPFVVNHKFASVDIDTQEDFDYANYILKNYNEE